MPMPATGLLQLYLWQGRMRVENLPVYIRRQMSRHPALTAALTPRLGACPGQTILVLQSRGLWQRRAEPSADAVRLRQTAWVTETGKTPPPRALMADITFNWSRLTCWPGCLLRSSAWRHFEVELPIVKQREFELAADLGWVRHIQKELNSAVPMGPTSIFR